MIPLWRHLWKHAQRWSKDDQKMIKSIFHICQSYQHWAVWILQPEQLMEHWLSTGGFATRVGMKFQQEKRCTLAQAAVPLGPAVWGWQHANPLQRAKFQNRKHCGKRCPEIDDIVTVMQRLLNLTKAEPIVLPRILSLICTYGYLKAIDLVLFAQGRNTALNLYKQHCESW
jgi:hypothetical protein